MVGWEKSILDIVLRSAVVYVFILAGLRLTGKREVGQMSPFDLVLLLLISNAVQNAMVGPNTSLAGGLISVATLLALNFIVARLAIRGGRLASALRGSPTLLVHDGRLIPENLKRERLTIYDMSQALREHGVGEISEVQSAVLEVDGSISVLRNEEIKEPRRARRVRFLKHR